MRSSLLSLIVAGMMGLTGCVTERYHQNDVEFLQRQINDISDREKSLSGYVKGREVKLDIPYRVKVSSEVYPPMPAEIIKVECFEYVPSTSVYNSIYGIQRNYCMKENVYYSDGTVRWREVK